MSAEGGAGLSAETAEIVSIVRGRRVVDTSGLTEQDHADLSRSVGHAWIRTATEAVAIIVARHRAEVAAHYVSRIALDDALSSPPGAST